MRSDGMALVIQTNCFKANFSSANFFRRTVCIWENWRKRRRFMAIIPITKELFGNKRFKRNLNYHFAGQDSVAPLALSEVTRAMLYLPIGFAKVKDDWMPVALQGLSAKKKSFRVAQWTLGWSLCSDLLPISAICFGLDGGQQASALLRRRQRLTLRQ